MLYRTYINCRHSRASSFRRSAYSRFFDKRDPRIYPRIPKTQDFWIFPFVACFLPSFFAYFVKMFNIIKPRTIRRNSPKLPDFVDYSTCFSFRSLSYPYRLTRYALFFARFAILPLVFLNTIYCGQAFFAIQYVVILQL